MSPVLLHYPQEPPRLPNLIALPLELLLVHPAVLEPSQLQFLQPPLTAPSRKRTLFVWCAAAAGLDAAQSLRAGLVMLNS